MRNIYIKSIPHSEQRYNTCGDYWMDEVGDIQIRVSNLNEPRYEELVAFHELAEVLLVLARGISLVDIDNFDKNYEKKRRNGDTSEPGDAYDAPYNMEHFFATTVERMLSREYEVDWFNYEDVINELT